MRKQLSDTQLAVARVLALLHHSYQHLKVDDLPKNSHAPPRRHERPTRNSRVAPPLRPPRTSALRQGDAPAKCDCSIKRRAALKNDVVQRAFRRPTPQHIAADRAKLWHPYAATPGAPCLPVRSAEGVRLELEDGTQLIDGMSSWWAAVHGYRVPELDRAVADQLSKRGHVMFGGLTHRCDLGVPRCCGAFTPSCASSSSDEVVGCFFFDFEPIRACRRGRRAGRPRSASCWLIARRLVWIGSSWPTPGL